MNEYCTNLGRSSTLGDPLKLKAQIGHHSEVPVTDCVCVHVRTESIDDISLNVVPTCRHLSYIIITVHVHK